MVASPVSGVASRFTSMTTPPAERVAFGIEAAGCTSALDDQADVCAFGRREGAGDDLSIEHLAEPDDIGPKHLAACRAGGKGVS